MSHLTEIHINHVKYKSSNKRIFFYFATFNNFLKESGIIQVTCRSGAIFTYKKCTSTLRP